MTNQVKHWFRRGEYVQLGKSSTVWRVISVNVGPGNVQKATLKSTTPGSSAWRMDRDMKDARVVDKPAT